jgi:hypothetical protein
MMTIEIGQTSYTLSPLSERIVLAAGVITAVSTSIVYAINHPPATQQPEPASEIETFDGHTFINGTDTCTLITPTEYHAPKDLPWEIYGCA